MKVTCFRCRTNYDANEGQCPNCGGGPKSPTRMKTPESQTPEVTEVVHEELRRAA